MHKFINETNNKNPAVISAPAPTTLEQFVTASFTFVQQQASGLPLLMSENLQMQLRGGVFSHQPAQLNKSSMAPKALPMSLSSAVTFSKLGQFCQAVAPPVSFVQGAMRSKFACSVMLKRFLVVCLKLHWHNLQKVLLAFWLTVFAKAKVGLSALSQVPLKNLEGMTSAAIPRLKKMMRKRSTSTWKTQMRQALLFLRPQIPMIEPRTIMRSAAMSTPKIVYLSLVSLRKISLWVKPQMVIPVMPRPTIKMTKAPNPEIPLRQVSINQLQDSNYYKGIICYRILFQLGRVYWWYFIYFLYWAILIYVLSYSITLLSQCHNTNQSQVKFCIIYFTYIVLFSFLATHQLNLNISSLPLLSFDLVQASAIVFFIVSSPSSYIFFIIFIIEALGSLKSSFLSALNLSSLKFN